MKNTSAKVMELEEQAKGREVLLSKLNIDKDEALKELEKLQTKVTEKSALKAAKHVIWDHISTLILIIGHISP
jgi:hypothetical protein